MNKLKEYRKSLKLSQAVVAQRAGVHVRLYQFYEANEKEPGVRIAIRLARALGTTVEELFPLEEE